MDILLVMDDASQKVYMQMAGPANRWFGWGYGGTAMSGTYATIVEVGPKIHERVLGNHAAGTALASELKVLSVCTNGGRAYISCERRLNVTGRYSFNTAQTSLPMIWGLGSTPTLQEHASEGTKSMSRAAAPRPRLSGVAKSSGHASVVVSNLIVALTNKLELSDAMLSSNWTSAATLWRPPGCGPPLLTFMTNVTVAVNNTNRGFFRITR